MLGTISTIIVKYWVEFILSLIVAGMGLFLKRYIKLEKEDRNRSQKENNEQLIGKIQEENRTMIDALTIKYNDINKVVEDRYDEITAGVKSKIDQGRAESKADDAALQNQIHTLSSQLSCLKAGMLSMQGKNFRADCRRLLEEGHEITLDEWEEIDADHEAYNGLGGNHKGDSLFELVKKKVENTLTDVN